MSAGWGLYDLFHSGAGDAISLKLEHAFGDVGTWFSDVSQQLGSGLSDAIAGLSSFTGAHALDGGAGADTLYAGFGASVLHGGAGADTYIWHVGDGPTLVDGIATGDIIQAMAGGMLPSLHFGQNDIAAACNVDGSWSLTFLDGAQHSLGSMVVQGMDADAQATLRLVGGDGVSMDLDLDAILRGAGTTSQHFDAAALPDRTDQLSQLLNQALDHSQAQGDAQPAGTDGVHATLFTNASEQSLQQEGADGAQQPTQPS
jgi:hypothetical protein